VYRINEPYGNAGDIFWSDAAAFRPLTDDETSPINAEVDPNEKKIVVNLTYQTLSCYEGNREVYFCRISSGPKIQGNWETPIGEHRFPWRKTISIHMAGGTLGSGWDTPFISWTYLFAGSGVAIHAAFWHNDFGTARSHGCVNCRPEDAKWIFRWTYPHVSLQQSDFDLTGQHVQGTPVIVTERSY
jgi:lipoprotein-anchoring transpeptidase ErfK/SrfK